MRTVQSGLKRCSLLETTLCRCFIFLGSDQPIDGGCGLWKIFPLAQTTHENRPERRALLALSVHLKKVVEGREDSCRGSFKILSILYSWEPWRQLHYEPARPPQHLICIFTGPRRRSRHATIVLAVEKADDKMSYYWPLPLRWKRSVRGREDVSASLPMVAIYGGRSIVVWFSRTPPS